MNPIFYPDLKIISLEDIKLQELVRKDRYSELAKSVKEEGILRNPPLVTPFLDDDTYLQLDGANRIVVIKTLGYKNCLVQSVDYSDPQQITLTSWSHVTSVNKDMFLDRIRKIPHLTITQMPRYDHHATLDPLMIAVVVCADKSVYLLERDGTLAQRMESLNKIVDLYGDIVRVFSESAWSWGSIKKRFTLNPGTNLFVQFPTFSPSQVMQLVDQKALLPAGVTRHVVYRRKLNVNLPLSFLKIKSLDEANEKLQKFLQKKTVRLYEEPVIYFE